MYQARLENITRRLGPAIGLFGLGVILSFLSPAFLTVDNILNILRQVSVISIIAAGETFVILTGGIDLSVGSVLGLCGVLLAAVLKGTDNTLLGVLTGIGLGAFLGYSNGILISKGKLPPFCATLGMMAIARGLAFVYTQGKPISGFGSMFRFFGSGYIGPIPVPIIIAVGLFAVVFYVLTQTIAGRCIYSLGSNETATRLSGIKTDYYKTLVYVICGLFVGIAAVVFTARINSGHPLAGQGYELDSIAAVVIGGTSLSGGEGTIIGTFIGALIMGVIRNGLNLVNVDPFWQQVAIGAVIIVAVLADRRGKQ
ncbi:MAG: ribose ABC transporter permease [Candidatus Atribacteria bacterium]|nr:ribose ABC transporter permease [Candidatus Atribacteria bacterium]